MIYDEPEPLPFAARHWLGAELLETKKYADAEQVYREDLKRHPHNGWSLFGLRAALVAEGKPSDEAAREFNSSGPAPIPGFTDRNSNEPACSSPVRRISLRQGCRLTAWDGIPTVSRHRPPTV